MRQALVSLSLRFGSLLNPTMGLSLNIGPQSWLFVIIFQFLWINSFMLGLPGFVICDHYWCCNWCFNCYF